MSHGTDEGSAAACCPAVPGAQDPMPKLIAQVQGGCVGKEPHVEGSWHTLPSPFGPLWWLHSLV